MSTWLPTWFPIWGSSGPPKTMKSTDAIRSPAILHRFHHFLDHTDPPASFKASEVAQELSHNELIALGYETWKDAVPAVIELAFELREEGTCELIKGGQVLGEDVEVYDVGGAVRIRRAV